MSKQWAKPYNILLKCIRGLENCLLSELQSFGISNNALIKDHGGITLLNGTIHQLYFLSYFSRISTGIFIEITKFPVTNREDLYKICRDINWLEFIDTNNTYSVSCTIFGNNSFIHSKKYGSQLIKDSINDYFRYRLDRRPPELNLKEPEIKLELQINSLGAKLFVNAIGISLSARSYRYNTKISDIDPTIACSLLFDVGYFSFSETPFIMDEYCKICKKYQNAPSEKIASPTSEITNRESQVTCNVKLENKTIVDLFSGPGTFLIESALYSAKVPPGSHVKSFSFQRFPTFDKVAFSVLKKYSECKQIKPRSSEWEALKGKFIGIEKDWEKLESSLRSAKKAGIVELLALNQANYLKDGIVDCNNNTLISKKWEYMILQLPKMFDIETLKSNTPNAYLNTMALDSGGNVIFKPSSGANNNKYVSAERYYKLLKNLSKIKNKFFAPTVKIVLLMPSIMNRTLIEDAFSNKLYGGKRVIKNGVDCVLYYTK